MANKRILKKEIRHICGGIAGECILAREFVEGADSGKFNEIIVRLADLQENTLRNVSFSFDKTARDFDTIKAYHKAAKEYHQQAYNKLRIEFNNNILEIVKQMNALLPQSQREENKKSVR